jgi:hypothetical protein
VVDIADIEVVVCTFVFAVDTLTFVVEVVVEVYSTSFVIVVEASFALVEVVVDTFGAFVVKESLVDHIVVENMVVDMVVDMGEHIVAVDTKVQHFQYMFYMIVVLVLPLLSQL